MDLTIGIAAYNGAEFIGGCLDSIFINMSPGLSHEVIAVDDASTDETVSILQRLYPRVRLIRHRQNQGLSSGTNDAVRSGQGRYHLRLDVDTKVQPGAMSTLVAFMDEHPRVGAVGPRLVFPDGKFQLSARNQWPGPRAVFWEFALPLNKALGGIFNLDGAVRDTARPQRVAHLIGAAMLLRRAAIDEVGLMDPQIQNFRDETDWQYRFSQKGWEIWYVPQAIIQHHGGQSIGNRYIMATPRNLKSFWYFNQKHYPGRLYQLKFLLAVLVGSSLSLLTGLASYLPGRFHQSLKPVVDRIIASFSFVLSWHLKNLRWLLRQKVNY